ncbi:hypothetical protein [Mycobacterium paraterrae]|uniref:Uncharacterized protein n=1 Tax=Mycobacterium paraterrae TaxID=577492 RepID=A0ABY3VEB5_9MYCO|nr:hypothetical protein [Mycobacterium paraterrae]UMB67782.1 hypothetical protein MKK62_14915 [Mycobacterium paraterrae]
MTSEESFDPGDGAAGETGETPPDEPWWRKPIVSLTVAVLVAFLLGITIFLLADRNSEHSGTTQTPTSPTAPAVPNH